MKADERTNGRRPGYSHDDERSSRDPKVWAAARKRHIANAVAWIKHYYHCRDTRPEGVEFAAILRCLRNEIKAANTTLAHVKELAHA